MALTLAERLRIISLSAPDPAHGTIRQAADRLEALEALARDLAQQQPRWVDTDGTTANVYEHVEPLVLQARKLVAE